MQVFVLEPIFLKYYQYPFNNIYFAPQSIRKKECSSEALKKRKKILTEDSVTYSEKIKH